MSLRTLCVRPEIRKLKVALIDKQSFTDRSSGTSVVFLF